MEFKARIKHNSLTYNRLCKMQFNLFYYVTRLIRIVLGFILLAAGFISRSVFILAFLFVVLGLVIITGAFTPYQNNASKMKKMLTKGYPETEYVFSESEISINNQYLSVSCPYSKIRFFLEDDKFYYLFTENTSAYMIDKKSVSPDNSFEKFIYEKTGCNICKGAKTYWTVSVNNLKEAFGKRGRTK